MEFGPPSGKTNNEIVPYQGGEIQKLGEDLSKVEFYKNLDVVAPLYEARGERARKVATQIFEHLQKVTGIALEVLMAATSIAADVATISALCSEATGSEFRQQLDALGQRAQEGAMCIALQGGEALESRVRIDRGKWEVDDDGTEKIAEISLAAAFEGEGQQLFEGVTYEVFDHRLEDGNKGLSVIRVIPGELLASRFEDDDVTPEGNAELPTLIEEVDDQGVDDLVALLGEVDRAAVPK